MIESVKVIAFVVYHVGLLLVSGYVAATIARWVFRRLNARRDKRLRAINGNAITLTFQGQTITIAARLPEDWPGCESCALEVGIKTPPDSPGEFTASFHCPRHYDEFAKYMRVAWARRQAEARRNV